MTTGIPWSVKGIDRKARETAKDLARRSGLTLGEWLNQMIEDQGPDEDLAPGGMGGGSPHLAEALDRLSARIEAAETRSTLAITGIDQSVRGLVARIEEAERGQTSVAARFEGGLQEMAGNHAKIADRLRRMEEEATGPRSLEALKAMEGTLAKVSGRISETETAAKDQVSLLRDELATMGRRMESSETGAVGMIDAVVGGIAERLNNAETGTMLAIKGLEASLGRLDKRLALTESRLEGVSDPQQNEQKLELLAAKLSNRVEAVRAEMAAKLHASADGRLDRMDRTLSEMTQHVQQAERRSAQALESMGREVLKMADTLGRKVQSVENRSAEAIEQVGGEVARIADQLDSRLHRADGAQAVALEKLGSEIARITERLSERIAQAERRSAQAVDDVGEQVSRVTERLNQRHERSAGDLAERIKQSEDRTAKLLEEARERIDTRMADSQKKAPEAAPAPKLGSVVTAPVHPQPFAPFTAAAEAITAQPKLYAPQASPFGPDPYAPAEPFGDVLSEEAGLAPPPAVYPDQSQAFAFAPPSFEAVEPDPVSPFAEAAFAEPAFGQADIEAAESFSPEPQSEADFAEPEIFAEPEEAFDDSFEPAFGDEDDGFLAPPLSMEPQAERPLSTRELIEQARAKARAASPDRSSSRKPSSSSKGPLEAPRGIPGLSFGSGKRRSSDRIKTGLMMSTALLFLAFAVVGWMILFPGLHNDEPAQVAENRPAAALPAAATAPDDGATIDLQPRASVLLDPQPITPVAPATGPATATAALATAKPTTATSVAPSAALTKLVAAAPVAAPAGPAVVNPVALYTDAMARIEAKDNSGVDVLRKSANLGYAPAQSQLGRMYENGQAGLPKNLSEARRWTERAAAGGLPKAMHNLAVYYFNGDGGLTKSSTTAAEWFRKAADLGFADSQYNLGLIYEGGFGVSPNPAEAYKWYAIAAKSGDAQSKAAAARLKAQLSPDALTAADRSAGSYAARSAPSQAPSPAALPDAAAGDVVQAQKALNKLGYYKGPQDGASSAAVRQAIQAYQRDQGLPPTGGLDTATSGKLAPYAR